MTRDLEAVALIARRHPLFVVGLKAKLIPAASFCYHLQAACSPGPFELSQQVMCEFLAPSLDPKNSVTHGHWQAVGRGAINGLLKAGVIQCVDPTFSKHNKQARKYRLGVS